MNHACFYNGNVAYLFKNCRNIKGGMKMSDENIFRALVGVMVVVALTISGYFRRKAQRVSGERVSRRADGTPMALALAVGGLSMWLSIAAYVVNPEWMAWAALPLPVALRWAGAVVSATALPLVYWLFSSLGRNITPTSATLKQHTLVTHGPYRWVRHPLYSIGTAFVLGIGLMAANGFIALMAVAAFVVLAIRTPTEEANLIAKFGDDYRAYMQRTGRFLPRLLR
jgi:protein-S-isoprenylcysteine O-methyltransferase Ste14